MGYRMPDKESREHLLYGELKRILSILVARDVKKVILFGSLTAGDIGSESDIDLIVVERTEKRFLERLDEVYSEVQPRVAAYSDEFVSMLTLFVCANPELTGRREEHESFRCGHSVATCIRFRGRA